MSVSNNSLITVSKRIKFLLAAQVQAVQLFPDVHDNLLQGCKRYMQVILIICDVF